MKQLTAREVVGKAIEAVFDRDEIVGSVVAKLEVVETEEVPTFATDGKHLFYNPVFVLEGRGLNPPGPLTISEATWVVFHEGGHVILGHMLRLWKEVKTQMQQRVRNIAADLALDWLLSHFRIAPSQRLLEFICFPGKGNFAELPGGKTAEWYLGKLPQPQDPPPQQPQQSQQQQQGQGQGQGQGKGKGKGQGQEEGDGESSGDGEGEPGKGKAGKSKGKGKASGGKGQPSQDGAGEAGDASGTSDTPGQSKCVSGQARGQKPGEKAGAPTPGENSLGEVLPYPGSETEEGEAMAEQEWQVTVAQAVSVAKSCGRSPGWLEEIVKSAYGKPVVNWRGMLRQFMTKLVQSGSSWSRPSRRQFGQKIILPSSFSNAAGDVALVADVSGSMSEQDFNCVLRELEGIFAAWAHAKVHVIQVDTRECNRRTFTKSDFPLRVPYKRQGFGGTDLNPGIKAAAKIPGVKAIIILTDMQWGYQHAPKIPIATLWLAVDQQDRKWKVPFGQVVHCPPSGK